MCILKESSKRKAHKSITKEHISHVDIQKYSKKGKQETPIMEFEMYFKSSKILLDLTPKVAFRPWKPKLDQTVARPGSGAVMLGDRQVLVVCVVFFFVVLLHHGFIIDLGSLLYVS